MQHILYEFLSPSHPTFRHVSISKKNTIQIQTIHQNLHNTLLQARQKNEDTYNIMLDESRFSFFRFDIHHDTQKPMSIHDLNQIIDEKIQYIRKNLDAQGEKLISYIDTIFVDNEEKKYCIGESGHIFFRLYIIYIRIQALHACNAVYGNIMEAANVHIVPESLYTTLFVRNTLKKDNFLLLYINEWLCKAVHVKNWFYHTVETINMGMSMVKKMYQDRWISEYRYKPYETIEKNQLAKQLIVETLEFFCEMLCKRIIDKNMAWGDIILISPMTKNEHFIDVFNQAYNKLCHRFIVPFHHADSIDRFNKKWEAEDMDILILMNREKQKMAGNYQPSK